ncbi:response regulator [Ferruginibacter sp.]|nr:response regulator transcription factor [Ferruginibacter sp.]
MSIKTIKVIIADDHEIFRDGLKLMLQKQPDIIVAGEAGDGKELIELVKQHLPDVVITDVKMPNLDGVTATKHLTMYYPSIGIIALTMFDEEDLIIDMLEAGAKGYLLKNADKTEIIEAVHTVADNESHYCRLTSKKLAGMVAKSRFNLQLKTQKADFNEREKEIIHYICEGLTSKEIGEKIFLSVRTVEGLRLKIIEKMNVKNTAGIIVYAIREHLYMPLQ